MLAAIAHPQSLAQTAQNLGRRAQLSASSSRSALCQTVQCQWMLATDRCMQSARRRHADASSIPSPRLTPQWCPPPLRRCTQPQDPTGGFPQAPRSSPKAILGVSPKIRGEGLKFGHVSLQRCFSLVSAFARTAGYSHVESDVLSILPHLIAFYEKVGR